MRRAPGGRKNRVQLAAGRRQLGAGSEQGKSRLVDGSTGRLGKAASRTAGRRQVAAKAPDAKRNAQSARRLRPPAAGSEQETTVGRWQLAANTKQHRRRGAGRAGDVASIVARLDPRDVNEVCHGTELRVAGDEAGILADGGGDGKGVRIRHGELRLESRCVEDLREGIGEHANGECF